MSTAAASLFTLALIAAAPSVARAGDVSGTYDAVHPHWRDTVTINADGTYRRGNGDSGHWTVEGELLVLGWSNWRPELLQQVEPGRYVAKNGFTIVKRGRRDEHGRHDDHDRGRHDRRVAPRDCGTGPDDPGCDLTRRDRSPLDRGGFEGVMTALRAQSNELVRKDTALTILDKNLITARQFGQIIALFNNELTRMDVVRDRASRMVDPQNALGFAATFHNSFTAKDYVEVVSALR